MKPNDCTVTRTGNTFRLNCKGLLQVYSLLNVEDSGIAFNNCGSRTGNFCAGYFPSGSDAQLQLYKARFLEAYLNTIGKQYTLYILPATYQIRDSWPSRQSVCGFLKTLGMIEVDSRPNKNHGPANMHLHVWCPQDNMKEIEKYVTFSTHSWKFAVKQSILDGELIAKLETAKPAGPAKKLFEDEMTAFKAKARPAPKRDALGRFIS
jgi:hypothetical protein